MLLTAGTTNQRSICWHDCFTHGVLSGNFFKCMVANCDSQWLAAECRRSAARFRNVPTKRLRKKTGKHAQGSAFGAVGAHH